MSNPKKSLDLVTIQATAYSRVAVAPEVTPKGLVCVAQHDVMIRPKQLVWVDLGYRLSTPCRVYGRTDLAVAQGLQVQADAFMPSDRIVLAVANIGEFMVELVSGVPLAVLEPVVWRLGEVEYAINWVPA
jgi:hypothetical protein